MTPIGLDCDADVSTVLLLDRARRVALTAIGRTLEGLEWDGEEIRKEVEDERKINDQMHDSPLYGVNRKVW